MRLAEFNEADREDAIAVLRPCADVPRWCEELADRRPFAALEDLWVEALRAAHPFTSAEIDGALAHHPRIGERLGGTGREAALSRSEQAGIDPADAAVQQALREGNAAYEERFGRVFLVRAAGRTAEEILTSLRTRLMNKAEAEDVVVEGQLREIALLRLKGSVTV